MNIKFSLRKLTAALTIAIVVMVILLALIVADGRWVKLMDHGRYVNFDSNGATTISADSPPFYESE